MIAGLNGTESGDPIQRGSRDLCQADAAMQDTGPVLLDIWIFQKNAKLGFYGTLSILYLSSILKKKKTKKDIALSR